MPYIYLITNDVNGKQYVGKTVDKISKRWNHHISDSFGTKHAEKTENRPLYKAINKYGIEHFHITEIEECPLEILSEREIYWIEYYNTYYNGYNATLGGDGRHYLDYEKIITTYKKFLNAKKTAEVLGIDRQTVTKVLKATNSFTEREIKNNSNYHRSTTKKIGQYDKNTKKLIAIYNSVGEAESMIPTGRHIPDVCAGRRKTAGGYIWRYIEE